MSNPIPPRTSMIVGSAIDRIHAVPGREVVERLGGMYPPLCYPLTLPLRCGWLATPFRYSARRAFTAISRCHQEVRRTMPE